LKKILLAILLLIASIPVYAQSGLHTPLEFQKAFTKSTRSDDGMPGVNYWQNHSEYKIDAELSTATRILKGTEKIVYYNESPDTLKYLLVRLYQDINKPENSRDWDYSKESFTEGMKINEIKINGTGIDIRKESERSGTNLRIKRILPPKDKTELYFDWSFEIPKGQSPRMGRYDSTTYMIAYWYPQMAVYDDIDGWDNINYTGQVEFYNDFSDYDVSLSVEDNPNCIIWATGQLQNPEDIFTVKYNELYKTQSTGKIINFINDENKNERILADKNKIIWHYKADYVPDFAFSLSDHYLWDYTDFQVESGRFVRIGAAYNPSSEGFNRVCKIAKDAISFLSTELPGVPYPYPSMTVFNGSGGMEFPMMVNDSKNEKYSSDVYLTSHEISHTYFPFYMGTNERKYAWMDEGWAVYLPQEFQTRNSEDNDSRERITKRYMDYAGTLFDVPIMVQSYQLKSPSYRMASYQKAALTYDILKDILGKDLFVKCLKEYINRWHGKHPTPYDFFNTFKNISGQNLDWFFRPWYFEFGYPDLGIKNVKKENGIYKVEVEKIGNYPVPVYLTFTTESGKELTSYASADAWSLNKGRNFIIVEKQTDEKIVTITLGNKYIPDINLDNNKINLNK
jgi:hypothetical protein